MTDQVDVVDPAVVERMKKALVRMGRPRFVSLPGLGLHLTKFCGLCGREYVGDQVAHLKTECAR